MMGKGDIHVCRQRRRERETVKVCGSIERKKERKKERRKSMGRLVDNSGDCNE